MYEIFERLLAENGVKAYDVAKATGVRQSTLSEWKRGTYLPKADKRKKIADYFGVTLAYLDGESEYPHGEPSYEDLYAQPTETLKVSVLNEITNDLPLPSITDIAKEVMVKNRHDENRYWGLVCNDNSMSPKILKGDDIIFRESKDFNNENICVVKVKHLEKAIVRKVIRTLNFVILQPINPEYDSMFFEKADDIEIIGVVTDLHREF